MKNKQFDDDVRDFITQQKGVFLLVSADPLFNKNLRSTLFRHLAVRNDCVQYVASMGPQLARHPDPARRRVPGDAVEDLVRAGDAGLADQGRTIHPGQHPAAGGIDNGNTRFAPDIGPDGPVHRLQFIEPRNRLPGIGHVDAAPEGDRLGVVKGQTVGTVADHQHGRNEFVFEQVGEQNPVFVLQNFRHFGEQCGNFLACAVEMLTGVGSGFSAQHADHVEEIPCDIKQVLVDFQPFGILGPAKQIRHPAGTLIKQAHHLIEFQGDLAGHLDPGDAFDFHGFDPRSFDILGLVGVDLRKALVIDEDVGDDAAFKLTSVHNLEEDFLKVLELVNFHATGDAVLCAVARAIASRIRPYDLLARLGGDEFVVLLADTTQEQSLTMAERIRQAVDEAAAETTPARSLGLSVSIGLAQHACGESIDALIRRADAAMYRDKRA